MAGNRSALQIKVHHKLHFTKCMLSFSEVQIKVQLRILEDIKVHFNEVHFTISEVHVIISEVQIKVQFRILKVSSQCTSKCMLSFLKCNLEF